MKDMAAKCQHMKINLIGSEETGARSAACEDCGCAMFQDAAGCFHPCDVCDGDGCCACTCYDGCDGCAYCTEHKGDGGPPYDAATATGMYDHDF